MEQKTYKGYNGTLILHDKGVTIQRGWKGWLIGGGLKGEKNIPYDSISALQYKKAGLTVGYLQLTIAGGNESLRGALAANKDENSVTFTSNRNAEFLEAKGIIEERIHRTGGASTGSSLDELEKLAGLKEKGVITEGEFQAKKKQLLGI